MKGRAKRVTRGGGGLESGDVDGRSRTKGVAVECNVQDWIAGSQLTVVVLAKMQVECCAVQSGGWAESWQRRRRRMAERGSETQRESFAARPREPECLVT